MLRQVRHPHFHESTRTEFTENKSKRFASLEIEVQRCGYGSDVNQTAEEWDAAIVEDGSLDEGGFEINTAPANGDRLLNQLEAFARSLSHQSAEVDEQCGTHIHIDARDFTFYDMRRLVLLYEKIEPALFDTQPVERRDSSYCKPCGKEYADAIRNNRLPKESKVALINKVYAGDDYDTYYTKVTPAGQRLRNGKRHKYNDARYHALNVHSWVYRGTVECRLLDGTVDYDDLACWALLWTAIVDTAYRMSEPGIVKLNGKPIDILLSIAPTDAVKTWIRKRTAAYA